jgi:hypothetical protein
MPRVEASQHARYEPIEFLRSVVARLLRDLTGKHRNYQSGFRNANAPASRLDEREFLRSRPLCAGCRMLQVRRRRTVAPLRPLINSAKHADAGMAGRAMARTELTVFVFATESGAAGQD